MPYDYPFKNLIQSLFLVLGGGGPVTLPLTLLHFVNAPIAHYRGWDGGMLLTPPRELSHPAKSPAPGRDPTECR